jgi:hypothetical protein
MFRMLRSASLHFLPDETALVVIGHISGTHYR